MLRFTRLNSSLVGKKIIAALTGIVLLGFLIGHVTGNLKVFTGNDADGIPHIDLYGHFLRIIGDPLVPPGAILWSARAVLLVSLILHVVTVIQLAMINQAARPVKYFRQRSRSATLPAKYMLVSGIILLVFIVMHLLHFTVGAIPWFGKFEHSRVYANLYHSFTQFPVAIMYVVAMMAIGFHLFHGVWSLFQTLGLDNPDRNRILRLIATFTAVGLFIGFSSIPLAFMLGFMPEPPPYEINQLLGH
jgi:succinate dehydrogenase / fumarate reductase cytochrome b subunit